MLKDQITVKEIARLAGVSIGTIDRVLHDRGGVSAETKAKIDGIVASLGYEPNLLARQLSLGKTYTFRVVLPRSDQDSGYWSLCLAGIRRAERDFAPYGTKFRIDEFDRYDREAYRALLADLAADPCDGLLIAPVLPEELTPILGAVPYVFLDRDAPGTAPVAAIGQDPFRGGCLAGRIMSHLARGSGTLVAVSAHAGDRHIGQRIEGFESFFGGTRAVEVAECVELERVEQCEVFLRSRFDRGAGVAGVMVANSSGHLVGEWLASRGAKEGCAVLSWDLVPANARALREGLVDCVVSQRPADQAREAVDRLFRAVVRGQRDATPASIPLEIYFKENIPEDRSLG
jgi:LacI family transcriptional regulator